MISLVAVLTCTGALLLALAPAPLSSQASGSLLAMDVPQSFDELFDTGGSSIRDGYWKYIYIHHSATVSGNSRSLAETTDGLPDHFVIGNGDGCGDGEIEIGQRWKQQLPPGRTPGTDSIVPTCISICLIGDFNQSRPTPTQQRQLVELVGALQNRLHIPRDHVFFDSRAGGPAGIGGYFPASDFRGQIRP